MLLLEVRKRSSGTACGDVMAYGRCVDVPYWESSFFQCPIADKAIVACHLHDNCWCHDPGPVFQGRFARHCESGQGLFPLRSPAIFLLPAGI